MCSVSVIIINYNTFGLTCKCIESIFEKEKNLSFEVILVDNGSSETSAAEFKKRFPDIILVESPINVGFSKGNNLGIAYAKGEHILLLNSDTILLNNAITRSLNFLEQENNVGVVAARLEYPEGRIQHNCQRFPSVKYKLFELLRLQKVWGKSSSGKILFGPFFDHGSVAYPDWVWGTFFMFKKKSLERLPGKELADDFFMYGEDMQWCMEFTKLGLRIAFTPEARVIHFLGSSGGSRKKWMTENLGKFMKLYYPGWNRALISLLDLILIKSTGHAQSK